MGKACSFSHQSVDKGAPENKRFPEPFFFFAYKCLKRDYEEKSVNNNLL